MTGKLSILCIFLWACAAIPLPAESLQEEALSLLRQFNAGLVRYQDNDPASPDVGGLRCPSCGIYHSRAAEALWPLAYEASVTGETVRMEQALSLARWLLRKQESDGSWIESEGGWKGTTTDQLHALVLAYPLLRDSLSRKEQRVWRRSIRRAADFLCRVIDNKYAYINYCATTAASLAETGLLLHRKKYLRKARRLAHLCCSKINDDGLLEGEGENQKGGKAGIDIGYNLEMSLWGLARYARLCSDWECWEQVLSSARAHRCFIYPDGTLDASMGLRSSKWSVWGSATADGCAPLWPFLAKEDPEWDELIVRNIRKMRSCITRSGLLAPGPDYDNIRDVLPCLYYTFTKAKGLAMALAWAPEVWESDTIATEPKDTLILFPSLRTVIIRKGTFQGTVTAYSYKAKKAHSKFMQRPSGGAMSLLWAEGFGLVQAGSQTEYHRWEDSFPWMPATLPLTPRIETSLEGGTYTNLYDFDATLNVRQDYGCSVSGQLKNEAREDCGIAYNIHYSFTGEGLVKEYQIRGGPARIVEPLILNGEEGYINCDGEVVRFERGDGLLILAREGAGKLRIDTVSTHLYKQIYPAFRAIPIVLDLPGQESTTRIRFSIGR